MIMQWLHFILKWQSLFLHWCCTFVFHLWLRSINKRLKLAWGLVAALITTIHGSRGNSLITRHHYLKKMHNDCQTIWLSGVWLQKQISTWVEFTKTCSHSRKYCVWSWVLSRQFLFPENILITKPHIFLQRGVGQVYVLIFHEPLRPGLVGKKIDNQNTNIQQWSLMYTVDACLWTGSVLIEACVRPV